MNLDVLSNYNSTFPDPEYPFLKRQLEHYKQNKPLQGVRILHNMINSFETLLKLEVLAHSGAELTITSCHFAKHPYQNEVDKVLLATGIPFIPNHSDLHGEFDIGMDCSADLLRLARVTFTRGCVELTRVGAIAYEKATLPYPVISVDNSHLKKLECMFGTGESFIRAFASLTNEDLTDRPFVLFGYGKIGKGIVKYLQPFTKNICVVEADEHMRKLAESQGLTALGLDNLDRVRAYTQSAFAIVTATGVPRMLSRYLTAADTGTAYLANMGVDDEIGPGFDEARTLFGRAPINFSLKHPTLMRYFDPICYGHNLAAELLVSRDFSNGFHAFPVPEDLPIVSEWAELYGEDLSSILN